MERNVKFGLYAISKNEEKNVQQFLNNIKLFDYVVVLDTGSTDKTVDLLKNNNVNVISKQYDIFDFSVARNDSLNLVPDDIDWVIYLDFNEILNFTEEDKRRINQLDRSVTGIKPLRKDNTEGVITIGTEQHVRMHRRHDYIWKYAVHEDLFIKEGLIEKTISLPFEIVKIIYRTQEKENFYFSICERELLNDPYNVHYLWFATQYCCNNKLIEKAFNYGFSFLNATEAYNHSFRPYVFCNLSRLHLWQGNVNKAADFAVHAVSEAIKFKETDTSIFNFAMNTLNNCGLYIGLINGKKNS